jgi:serine/threonine-protein kinase
MAVVWRGVDERLGRPVAVKVLDRRGLADPTTVERFDREARAVARLNHPNIVAVYDVGLDDDMPYLVMELVDGQSLAAYIADGPMRIDDALTIAVQVCDALQAAHAAGVVHRDVKPANILVTPAGPVKVCDFGIARVSQKAQAKLTASAVALGTAEYMAPEQATGGQVDARTDLYALGCVLYAMLSGAPPFHGDNALGIMWQHVNQPAAPLVSLRPDVSGALNELIMRLLAKDARDRLESAHEVRDRLASAAGRKARSRGAVGGAVAPVATAAPAVRAQAAVVTPTRTMPALDTDLPPDAAARDRFRLGPAGIAAVAIGAAIVAAIAVAILTSQQPGQQAGQTPPAATVPGASPGASSAAPVDGVAAVEAVIQVQLADGNLDEEAARKLMERLDNVANEIDDGDLDDAAKKVGDFRKELRDLRREGRVMSAAYDAILASLDTLTLPRNGGD